jgi:hypothetical protein
MGLFCYPGATEIMDPGRIKAIKKPRPSLAGAFLLQLAADING